MAETVDVDSTSVEEDGSPPTKEDDLPGAKAEGKEDGEEEESKDSASELVEQLGRDAGTLIFREVQVRVSRQAPELRRLLRDIALALVVVAALVTAFALLNWALVRALSTVLSGWRAPAVLAAAWIVVGVGIALWFAARVTRGSRRWWWLMLRSDTAAAVADREQAREQAEREMRETLERLAAAVGREAGDLIASAIVPLAGGVVEVGEDILEGAEEMIDVIEEEVPGGGLVTDAIDLALLPGRFGARIVTAVLRRGPSAG